jgi:hypothetical protein
LHGFSTWPPAGLFGKRQCKKILKVLLDREDDVQTCRYLKNFHHNMAKARWAEEEKEFKASHKKLLEDVATDEALDKKTEEMPLCESFNPDMTILWQFTEKSGTEWETFDRLSNAMIEMAHNAGTLKAKIVPKNMSLKFKGHAIDHLILIQKRQMIVISTGVPFQIRRRVPSIHYNTLSTGTLGAGDQAASS